MNKVLISFVLFFTFFLFQNADASFLKDKTKNHNPKQIDIFIIDKKTNKFLIEKGLIDNKGVVSTKCKIVLKWLKEVDNALIIKANDGKLSQVGKIISCNIPKDQASFLLEPLNPEDEALLNELQTPTCNKAQSNEVMKPVINLQTDNIRDLFGEALRQHKLRDYNTAISFYKKALTFKPDFVEAHINLGNIYFRTGSYHEAIDSYNSALKYSQDNKLSILSKLGTTYLILENYEKAIETYKQIIELKNDSPYAYFYLGLAYYIRGNDEEAFNEYINLERIDPQLAEDLFDLLYR